MIRIFIGAIQRQRNNRNKPFLNHTFQANVIQGKVTIGLFFREHLV